MGKSDKNKGTKDNTVNSKNGGNSTNQTQSQKCAQGTVQQQNGGFMLSNQGYNQTGYVQGPQNYQFNSYQDICQGQGQQGQTAGYVSGNYQYDQFVPTSSVNSAPNVPQNCNITNYKCLPSQSNQSNRCQPSFDINTHSLMSSSAQGNPTQVNNNQMPNSVQNVNGTSSGQNNQMYGSLHGLIQEMNTAFMSRFDVIDQKVSKLDSIERDVSFTGADVARLKQENTEIKRKVDDVENTCSTISAIFDEFNERANQSETEMHNLRSENSRLKTKVSELESKCSKVTEDLLEIKARSMQESLLFFGIAEASLGENDYTETKLRDILVTELKAPNDRIQRIVFDRVHRIGRPYTDPSTGRVKPRPVVAKFENYTDREYIRKMGIELNKQRIGFSIREHFPPEIEERRKTLYPVLRSFAKDERNRVALVRDELYINGKLYEGDPVAFDPNRPINKQASENSAQYDRRYVRPKQNRNRPQPKSVNQDVGSLLMTANRFQSLENYSDTPIPVSGKKKRYCENLVQESQNDLSQLPLSNEHGDETLNEDMDTTNIPQVPEKIAVEQIIATEGVNSNQDPQNSESENSDVQGAQAPEPIPANITEADVV